MNKRIIWILFFVLFAVLAAAAIYFVFFQAPETPGPTTNESNVNSGSLPSTNVDVNRQVANANTNFPLVNGSTPTNAGTGVNASPIANGGVTEVSTVTPTQDAIGAAVVNSLVGTISYYNQSDNKFYTVDSDGEGRRELSPQEFPDAEEVVFSDNGTKAVITFPDDSKIIYDFSEQRQYTLPKESDDFSFSPNGNEIAYKYLPSDIEDRWIVTTGIDGSGLEFIEALGDEANNVDVNWSPTGEVVATFRKSIDTSRQEIFFVGQNKENFKSAIVEGRGFEGDWSPTGNQMLYSVYSSSSSYNPELYIVNASGDAIGSGRTALGLNTWSDKCQFSASGTTLYCAEPAFLTPGSGLNPDSNASTNDRFYEVNLITGDTQLIAEPIIGVNATNLYLSADGKILYYTNKATGRLESIRLS